MKYMLFDSVGKNWSTETYSLQELKNRGLDPSATYVATEDGGKPQILANVMRGNAEVTRNNDTKKLGGSEEKPTPAKATKPDKERTETFRLVRMLCRFLFVVFSLQIICGAIVCGFVVGRIFDTPGDFVVTAYALGVAFVLAIVFLFVLFRELKEGR